MFPPQVIIPEVAAQQVENAALFWEMRDRGASRPDYTLKNLAEVDERLEAALDGIRDAGEAGWEMCLPGLAEGTAGEAFVAAVLALESGEETKFQQVIGTGCADAKKISGVIGALAWLPLSQVSQQILKLLRSQDPLLRQVGISAACAHRRDPGNSILDDAVKDADPALRARALRAVGELGAVELVSYIRSSLRHEDPSCRFWAAWSAALLQRDKEALQLLRTFSLAGKPFAEPAVQMVMRTDDFLVCHRVMQRLMEMPDHRRTAVVAAGALGDPSSIPWLIGQMPQPALARVAGEAFCMITGADLSFHDLDMEAPEPVLAERNEEPEEPAAEGKTPKPAAPTEEEVDPDENLHWPNPTLVQQWWERHKGGFAKGIRYLGRKPINEESLNEILRQGKQRQRAAAALELALRNPEKGLFEVRAPAPRQKQLLGIN